MSRPCPNCGFANADDAVYCDQCGTALTALAGSPYQVFTYNEAHARDHRAYASIATYVIRFLINIVLPIGILIVFWERFRTQGIGVIVMLLVGLAMFTGRDLWTRRHLLRAKRSAVVWDRPHDEVIYVTVPEAQTAQDPAQILRALEGETDAEVVRLTDRWVKYRTFRSLIYTYRDPSGQVRTFDIPQAFPGLEAMDP